jgi:RNA polymerase sigma-70 factor (ECF subfamily)
MGAFDALVTLFGSRVMSVAMRLLNDRGEAEDLTQEVFVALHHHLPEFRGESRLSTWIYRITKNRALNRLKFLKRRHHGNHIDVDDPIGGRSVSDPDTGDGSRTDPVRGLSTKGLSAVLEVHLRALPEEQRTLVILRDLEDLSYEEIADVTGLPLGTVKSRLHRARAELAKGLRPHLDDLT